MEHINSIDGVIVFTDLKDFTLKTSLLTQKQIDALLDDQDTIILDSLKTYNGTLIKTIGDSYMMLFEDIQKSLDFAIEVQNKTKLYNESKNLKLQKIELRMSLDYGKINKKNTVNGIDYFWDSVNLSSRLLSKTLENKIFVTNKYYESFQEKILENSRFVFLWNTNFKWILYEVWVYEVLFDSENIKKVDSGKYEKPEYADIIVDEKIKKRVKNIDDIIFKWSAINAVLCVQPIPFVDLYSTTWVYIYMLKQIAKEYNIELSREQIKEILVTILWAIAWVIAINQTMNGLGKIGTFGLAWFLLVPINFGTCYWVGKVMNRYFYDKTKEVQFTNSEMKELFLSGKDYWVKYAKENKKEILEVGKEFKDELIEFAKKSKDDLKDISSSLKNIKK